MHLVKMLNKLMWYINKGNIFLNNTIKLRPAHGLSKELRFSSSGTKKTFYYFEGRDKTESVFLAPKW